jgi:hypothetical protein
MTFSLFSVLLGVIVEIFVVIHRLPSLLKRFLLFVDTITKVLIVSTMLFIVVPLFSVTQ